MKSDRTGLERSFATFRVAGDNLAPAQVSVLLGVEPTQAYAKDQPYGRGPRAAHWKGRTGVWLLSTDGLVQSDSLTDHVKWLLNIIAPKRSSLHHFLHRHSLHAVMTCFWHGPAGSSPPIVSKATREFLEAIPAELEEDFEVEAQPPVTTAQLKFR